MPLLLGLARLVVFAFHRAVAADRQQVDTIVRSAARRGPLDQRRAEAEGEIVDPNPGTARDDEVAGLVQEDDHRDHNEEDDDLLEALERRVQEGHYRDVRHRMNPVLSSPEPPGAARLPPSRGRAPSRRPLARY